MEQIAKRINTAAGNQYLKADDGEKHPVEAAVFNPGANRNGEWMLHPSTGVVLTAGTFAGRDCWIQPDEIGIRPQFIFSR